MAKKRRRKLKRWLYYPLALVVVLIATPIFMHFAGDGAQKRTVEEAPPVEEILAEPTPTPIQTPDRLFAFYNGETWGYKDQAGRTYEAISQTYEAAQEFSEGLAFVGNTIAGVMRWSLIDNSGQVIAADLPYSEVRPFSGGYAAVKGNEGWGFINAQGLEVIVPRYDMVGDCSVEKLVQGVPVPGTAPTGFADVGALPEGGAADGLAGNPVGNPTDDGAAGAGDATGIPPEGAGVTDGNPTLPGAGIPPSGAAEGAEVGGMAGEGSPTPTQQPVEASPNADGTIECGLAVVGKNGLYGYVAPGLGDNPPEIALTYTSASVFGDGLAFVGVKQGDNSIRYSVIDKNAAQQAVIDGQGSYFSDMMAPVRKSSGQYVYYDASNVLMEAFIDPNSGGAATFEDAKAFCDGMAPVKVNGLWGYISKESANPVIMAQYRDAMPFSEGLAVVQNDAGKWGAIDRNGQTRIAFDYEELTSFTDGYALGRKVDNYYAVSLAGEEAQLYVRSASAAAVNTREMVVQLSEGTLRVRSTPGTDGEVVSYVENGTRVTVIAEEGEWSRVEVPGNITGYLKTEYLRTP